MKTKLFVLKIPFVTWREIELIICQLQGAELFFLSAENKHTRNQLLWNKCECRLIFKLLAGKNQYISTTCDINFLDFTKQLSLCNLAFACVYIVYQLIILSINLLIDNWLSR